MKEENDWNQLKTQSQMMLKNLYYFLVPDNLENE